MGGVAAQCAPLHSGLMEFLQQLINGLSLGAIYALIALGYTMVYGILRFINFAHSDVLMLGAFAAYFLAPAVAHLFPLPSYSGALLVTALAAGICAILGILIELLAYRPLRNRPKLTVLITAIGVSLFIEFTCQHHAVFGAATKPFPNLSGNGCHVHVSLWDIAPLKVLVEEGMIENAERQGAYFQAELAGLRSNLIREVRGRGLMLAVELHPEAGGARRYCEALQKRGVLAKDTHGDTIRIAPPLVITADQVDWALQQIDATLKQDLS